MDLELCRRFWYRIYHIQRRGIYSFYEIEKLVKDIESVRDRCPDPERLTFVLDECYKDMDSPDLQKRLQLISHLRTIFHRPLKEANKNPYNSVMASKILKNKLKKKYA